MNHTSSGDSVGRALSYLNQTSFSLLSDKVIVGHLVNYPYRIALSLVEAIRIHYQEAVASSGLLINLQSMLNVVGYFFSSYAVGCFIIALILNRFVLMASLRSHTRSVSIPLWSRYSVHLLAVIPLVYNIIQAFCQLGIMNVFPVTEVPFFLTRTFLIFAWSHCVETFMTTTSNLKPLEESDYAIFELSLQFYFLCQSSKNHVLLKDHLPDFMMALFGRILIHFVEMFNVRRYRLLGSTILNILNLSYLGYRIKTMGFQSLPVFTRMRHFPKFFSLFLIILSGLTYLLACAIRKNPFSSRRYDTSELQFHSFMHNWWNHLNCTGEEEFSSVISKLALLLCNGTDSMEKGMHREFSALNIPKDIHQSFLVSGYTHRMSTIPDDINITDSEKQNKSGGGLAFVARIKLSYNLIKQGCLFFIKGKYWAKRSPKGKKKGRTALKSRDLNRFITDRNYAKFLGKPTKKVINITTEPQLPEDDFSEDYVPIEDDSEDVDESEFESNDMDVVSTIDEDMTEEIHQLLVPDDLTNLESDMKWFMSMWSILSYPNHKGKHLTRSLYASLNSQGVLTDVLMERSLNYPHNNYNSERIMIQEDSDDEQMQFCCVVCRINQRNVVLWPCRCLAICEDCRISLGLRGFQSCVCCRSDVHGYSKLNVV